MIKFIKTELKDITEFKKYLPNDNAVSCDGTVGGIFMWFDEFNTYHAVINDTLIQKITVSGEDMFAPPCGKDVTGAIFEIYSYCRQNGIPCKFYGATDNFIEILAESFEISKEYERDICDYVYLSSDLMSFSGKKYHGQKNHLNAFKKLYSEAYAKKTDTSDIEEVKAFMEKYKASAHKSSEAFLKEIASVERVLDNFSLYGFEGLAVYYNGEVISFTAGEVIGDTMYAHIEKALPEYRGLYQYTVCEFSSLASRMGAVYINREDDTGDEGLRTSKLAYKPCKLVDKYTVTIKGVKK